MLFRSPKGGESDEAGDETPADEIPQVTVESHTVQISKPEAKPEPVEVHSTADLAEKLSGKASDAPLCMTCGTKMQRAGSCYVCEGCGSTSGCS